MGTENAFRNAIAWLGYERPIRRSDAPDFGRRHSRSRHNQRSHTKKPSAKTEGFFYTFIGQSCSHHLLDATRASLPSNEHQASASNQKQKTASNHHAYLSTGEGQAPT
jgi:hypothetical protein